MFFFKLSDPPPGLIKAGQLRFRNEVFPFSCMRVSAFYEIRNGEKPSIKVIEGDLDDLTIQ